MFNVDKEALDKAFKDFKESAALSDEEAVMRLIKSQPKMSAFLKSWTGKTALLKDIAIHFMDKVDPHMVLKPW